MSNFTPFVLLFLFISGISAQEVVVEGYVFESGNRGYLNTVELIFLTDDNIALDTCYSNVDGYFSTKIPDHDIYRVTASKNMFDPVNLRFRNPGSGEQSKVFQKIEMFRSPGYIFEITLANEKIKGDDKTDAISGSLIEVYNNTKKEVVLEYENYKSPEFKVALLKGNHYTILIRKPGYFAKRMEAYVDVEGCILCIDGLGQLEPGVSDNLSEGNQMGVLLANVELERIFKGKKLQLNNLYYDFGKWDLKSQSKEELDKVVTMMADNPKAKIELGAHTDSRGSEFDNLNLSRLRAQSAVRYLINRGVPKNKIIAKGYGESELINQCSDGVACSEEEHLLNRRTELKILSLEDGVGFKKSLAEMKREEQMEATLEEIQFKGQVKIPDAGQSGYQEEIASQAAHGVKVTNDKNIEASDPDPTHFEVTKIVIRESTKQIPQNHALYMRHPNMLEIINQEGRYLYLVGHFDNRSDAELFLSQTIQLVYPDAYIVSIINGEIKDKN